MLNSFSSLVFVIIIYLFSCVPQGNTSVTDDKKSEDNKVTDELYSPFVVVRELYENKYETNKDYQLPSFTEKIKGEVRLRALIPAREGTDANRHEDEEKLFCPEIDEEHNSEFEKAAYSTSPTTRSCLFEKKFNYDDPIICKKEPIPWLVTSKETKESIPESVTSDEPSGKMMKFHCNEIKGQALLSFEYNCCEVDSFLTYGKQILQNPYGGSIDASHLFTDTYEMYQLCFDFKVGKPAWTRHQILQPMLMYNPEIREQNKNYDYTDLEKMNTSTYNLSLPDFPFPDDSFTKLKKSYQDNAENMIPQYLVPSRHMALKNWKKATHHMINTAPLQPSFRKLMEAIDEGLARITTRKYTETGVKLHIFTKVDTNDKQIKKLNKPYYNIWYKFIYNEYDKSGALITIYNTPEPPQRTECANELKCKFKEWRSPIRFSKTLLQYVHCCPIKTERVRQLFQVELKVEHMFYLQPVYENFHEEDDRLHFIEEVRPPNYMQIVPVDDHLSNDETSDNEPWQPATASSETKRQESLKLVPLDYEYPSK